MVRFVFVLLLVGGLTLLAVQNWSPSFSLVFLGLRSLPLPLALWILLAIGAGALSTLLISALVSISGSLVAGTVKRKVAAKTRFRPNRTAQSRVYQDSPLEEDWEAPTPTSQSRSTSERVNPNRSSEDYFDEDLLDDEDDFIDEREPQSRQKPPTTNATRAGSFNRRPEPTQDPKPSNADSGYSYSYRDPGNFGAGRREAVYDAEYRVIVPPGNPYENPSFYQEPEINRQPSETVVRQAGPKEEEEDWGFDFDDEDFIDDESDDRRR